ncbi:hypothetical protein NMG60_11017607 [Bertholletia excelsa]
MEAAMETGSRLMMDDLLNFTLDDGEEDDDDEKTLKAPPCSSNLNSQNPDDDHQSNSLLEFAEEELEWLSNKDAFPALDSCLDILSDNPGIVLNHLSPVSVLENSNSSSSSSGSNSNSNSSTITSCCGGSIPVPARHFPVKARSKRRQKWRRGGGLAEFSSPQVWWWNQVNVKNSKQELKTSRPAPVSSGIGRRCLHCQAEKTPQWRAGPMGPKTLCNACGVRYKSGRLVPEYRPASSPTFSNLLHSNSHRKIMEMRRQKQIGGIGLNDAG